MSSPEPVDDLSHMCEAVLFSVGKWIELEAISKLVGERDYKILRTALRALQKRYHETESSLGILDDGTKWKLHVRDRYLPLVRKIVADTELSRSVMETLAVIAWKNPVIQSLVIKIRTNKAYDHIKELEELGFISRQKHGRSMMIKLADKFFTYFEVEGDRGIREVFGRIKESGQSQEKLGDLAVFETADGEERPAGEEETVERLGELEVVDEEPSEEQDGEVLAEAAPEAVVEAIHPEPSREEPIEEPAAEPQETQAVSEPEEPALPQEPIGDDPFSIDLDRVNESLDKDDVTRALADDGDTEPADDADEGPKEKVDDDGGQEPADDTAPEEESEEDKKESS
ncbi:MAG: SMC-Scp complex subunit ScpB [archaeon]